MNGRSRERLGDSQIEIVKYREKETVKKEREKESESRRFRVGRRLGQVRVEGSDVMENTIVSRERAHAPQPARVHSSPDFGGKRGSFGGNQ